MSLKLVIGDKNYSSWSLRAALALDLTGVPYEEILERLYRPDSRARLLSHSPTGKVPVLLTEEGPVWDSLAIAEYLAERFPEAHLWADCRQRFGQDGAFLFGHASIADAFFAPVAARLRSYRVALPAEAAAYVETIYQWPAFRRWYQAALQEVQG